MARGVELLVERVRRALGRRMAEAPPQPEVRELVLAERESMRVEDGWLHLCETDGWRQPCACARRSPYVNCYASRPKR